MNITLKEAEQNIVAYSSQYMIDNVLNDLDNAEMGVKYATLRDDMFSGLDKQKYNKVQKHAFSHRLEFMKHATILAKSIRKITSSKNQSRELQRYAFVLDKYPEEFKNQVYDRYIWI